MSARASGAAWNRSKASQDLRVVCRGSGAPDAKAREMPRLPVANRTDDNARNRLRQGHRRKHGPALAGSREDHWRDRVRPSKPFKSRRHQIRADAPVSAEATTQIIRRRTTLFGYGSSELSSFQVSRFRTHAASRQSVTSCKPMFLRRFLSRRSRFALETRSQLCEASKSVQFVFRVKIR